jgi:hypothetical protein
VYLDLTKEEREKKNAEKKAQQQKIADGFETVEATKTNDPDLWSLAVGIAAEATIGLALGKYVWGAKINNDEGYIDCYWSWSYNRDAKPSNQERIQWVIMSIASELAQRKVGALSAEDIDDINSEDWEKNHAVLSAFFDSEEDIESMYDELAAYAKLLVDTYWSMITEVGTYLLAVREMKSRTMRSIQRKTIGDYWNKPTFNFSPAVSSVMLAALGGAS